ncbi:MAG: sugar transferase [Deltaproteobacteria bacterium]|nr:sugar transferase [Deltaproteobacteria bacterium]
MVAPICLFVFNRPEKTQATLSALKKNDLADESDLFIFCDGPRDTRDNKKIRETRKYVQQINGFKSVTIQESETNIGLANSIIKGVSQTIEKYGNVITLEDDLISSTNFLLFMNEALDFFQSNSRIFSISGYTPDLSSLHNYSKDFYLGYRASSWGWGTWKNRWGNVDWTISDYPSFKNNLRRNIQFMRGGSDLPQMLYNQMHGIIDSWAIRWCYSQFVQNQLTVFPSKSKINNVGFGEDSTHTRCIKGFNTPLDSGEQKHFNFQSSIKLNASLVKEFRKKYSFISRIRNKFV